MLIRSRRDFLKTVGVAAAAASAPAVAARVAAASSVTDVKASSPLVANRAPLGQSSFYPFPLTSIRPKGWLKRQMEIQAAGLSGHLDEFWPDVGPESGWLGGNGESWERGPYFLDGLVPLAYQLQDQKLIGKAEKWVNWTLQHPQANGMIGPAKNDDWWPRMVMLKVLTQYQEATGDSRVIPLMERYFAFQASEMPKRPLRDWGKYRWQDEALSVVWLYNRTGNRDLLKFAELLHTQGYDWQKQFANFSYTHKISVQELGFKEGAPPPDLAMQTHGVNNAMALKSSALWWLFSKQDSDRDGVQQQLEALDRHHGIPNGMFSADEHLAGTNPSQGIELCAVVEQMFSLEHSLAILGTAALGDRLEKIAYNALPGTLTDDMWAHQYDQEPNQIQCSLSQRPWTTNGPESNLYGLEPNFGCCTANMHQGWPKLTASLWMASASGGLAAAVYAPCQVRTTVAGGVPVAIDEETLYPFRGDVVLTVRPDHSVRFPMHLRIPQWADGATIRVNGKATEGVSAGSFTVLDREWKARDRVEIHFPMKPRVTRWYHNSVAVERGPVIFSLNVAAEWKKLRTRGMTADWEVQPKSAWNYALAVNEKAAESALKVTEQKGDKDVFTLDGAPVRIEVKGRKVKEWREIQGVAGDLPESPMATSEPEETLTLVPYGAAKLRITAFPEVA
jgi:uncharacterized protein